MPVPLERWCGGFADCNLAHRGMTKTDGETTTDHFEARELTQDVFHHIAIHIGRVVIAATVTIGQFSVI